MQDIRSSEEVVGMLSEAMLTFAAAVDRIAAQHAVELPGPQALADTAELMRQVQRLHIVQLQRLADVDARGVHALDDAASTGSWVAASSLRWTAPRWRWLGRCALGRWSPPKSWTGACPCGRRFSSTSP